MKPRQGRTALEKDTERPLARRPSLLPAEERLKHALEEIGRLRPELPFEATVLEIERLADKQSGERPENVSQRSRIVLCVSL